jgi:predicted nucleotidyltransferase
VSTAHGIASALEADLDDGKWLRWGGAAREKPCCWRAGEAPISREWSTARRCGRNEYVTLTPSRSSCRDATAKRRGAVATPEQARRNRLTQPLSFDMAALDVLVPKLVRLPGVIAVSLGGSRARGTHRADSDWDIGLYYRGSFDARRLADLGYRGQVAQPGEWGRIVNGGAWLSVDDEPVDVLLRDLDRIDAWWKEAQVGQFDIDNVEGHVAGLPTYNPIGEIALGRLLEGDLPEVHYPDALRRVAEQRWRWNGAFSLKFAAQYAERGDVTLAVGTMARATVQTAHGLLAGSGRWALNEKRLVGAAGLAGAHDIIGSSTQDLVAAVAELTRLLDPPQLAQPGAHTDTHS